MRRILVLLLVFLGFLFLMSNFAQLERVGLAIRQGEWGDIAVAVALVLLWLINLAAVYRAIYRGLGVEENLLTLFVLATASIFVNIITPGGLIGGVALFSNQAAQRGYSTAKATLSGLLFLVFDLIAFAIVLVIGLIVLFRRDDLTTATFSASAILFMIAGCLFVLVLIGIRSAEHLGKVLGGIARLLNRLMRTFVKREFLSVDLAVERGREAANGLREISERPGALFWPFVLALNGKAIQIAVFWMVFFAFDIPYSVGTIVAGFSIAFLFMVVSPTPAGIGVVETLLPLTLSAMYVPLDAAVVITLTYRGLTFWLPIMLGMVSMRFIGVASRLPVPRSG